MRTLVEKGLIEKRRFRALAIYGEKRNERERLAAAVLECGADLLANELLPLRGFDARNEPIAH